MRTAKRIISAFVFVIAASALFPVNVHGGEVPPIVQKIARHKDFFAVFWGYRTYRIYDVREINDKLIGLNMFDDLKIMHILVFDQNTQKIIYRDQEIYSEEVRAERYKRSIKVDDAVKIARFILEAQNDKSKKVK